VSIPGLSVHICPYASDVPDNFIDIKCIPDMSEFSCVVAERKKYD
jgi:hypothetical protein